MMLSRGYKEGRSGDERKGVWKEGGREGGKEEEGRRREGGRGRVERGEEGYGAQNGCRFVCRSFRHRSNVGRNLFSKTRERAVPYQTVLCAQLPVRTVLCAVVRMSGGGEHNQSVFLCSVCVFFVCESYGRRNLLCVVCVSYVRFLLTT